MTKPDADWLAMSDRLGVAVRPLVSPWERLRSADRRTVDEFMTGLDPFSIRDDPALTHTLGYADAWTSHASSWVACPSSAREVADVVDAARDTGVPLVIRGGRHSYLGTSNAADSLLIWTRTLDHIELVDAFVASGAPVDTLPVPAVSVGAGAVWGEVYEAVTSRGGRYVQGGGCTTVGVAGLVQSGGFGSFSRRYGTAAGGLLEAEVVTADGRIRTVNQHKDAELFWALRGGGGGTFGVVTRLALATHDLPATAGMVRFALHAESDNAFRSAVRILVGMCGGALLSPHWGEQLVFLPGRWIEVAVVFESLPLAQALDVWQPLLNWVRADPAFEVADESSFESTGQQLWDPEAFPPTVRHVRAEGGADSRTRDFVWAGDHDQSGQFIAAFQSTWLSQDLLHGSGAEALTDALIRAARYRSVALHLNKGLAGADREAVARSRGTSTHPAAFESFALAIVGCASGPKRPGVPGYEPDLSRARQDARDVRAAIEELRALTDHPTAYLSECDYFLGDWMTACWGEHTERLRSIKRRFDPTGLFHVHHGIIV